METVRQIQQKLSATESVSNSNGLLAKLAFLILTFAIFLWALRAGTTAIAYTRPKPDPHVLRGALPGSQPRTIPQDPADPLAQPLRRSSDQPAGTEFTYSLWIRIDPDPAPGDDKPARPVFVKGTPAAGTSGVAASNAPGIYLVRANTLRIAMDTFDPAAPTQTLDIPNAPMNKWTHLALRMRGQALDVYVDGRVKATMRLAAAPRLNFHDAHLAPAPGFPGAVADVIYRPAALSAADIRALAHRPPDQRTAPAPAGTFLAHAWFR